MAERRDYAAIKLFGQTIRIPEELQSPAAARNHDRVDKGKIVNFSSIYSQINSL